MGLLCFVFLSCGTVSVCTQELFGLIIGTCMTLAGYATRGVSVPALNPAVALCADLAHAVHGGGGFGSFALFGAFEVAGAIFAVGAFFLAHRAEYGHDREDLP